MTLIAVIVFLGSLIGIATLFAFKYREERAGLTFAPALKEFGDIRALDFKAFLMRYRAQLATWPPRTLIFLRSGIRSGALSFASFARILEKQSHHLADLVSHKHGFERRQTRSMFLQQVSEYKNGSAQESTEIR